MAERAELLNLTELRTRGWTPAMVRRLLGKEDAQRRNPCYRGAAPQRLYGRARVLTAEGSLDFEAARAKGAVRAERSRAIAERKKTLLLEEIAQLKIHIRPMDPQTLHKRAVGHYHRRQLERLDYDPGNPQGQMLDRLCVNFVRHELTRYDEHLAELFGRIGKEAAVFAIREKVYGAIAAAYPYLAAECQRQLDERRPPLPASAAAARSAAQAGPAPQASVQGAVNS